MLEALAAITKVALYAGLLSGAGAAFAVASLRPYLGATSREAQKLMRGGATAALLSCVATVLILIERLGGQFDGPTLAAVFEGPTGIAAGLQVSGNLIILLCSTGAGPSRLLPLAGGLLATASFGVNGHGPAAGAIEGLLAFVHVSAAAWWIGSLWLLRTACSTLSLRDLANLVRAFSVIAMGTVGALVIAGAILVISLVDFTQGPLLTPYGQALATKAGLAALVLGMAVHNKTRLTPRLVAGDVKASAALGRMITAELTVIGLLLATTAFLTTYTSPHA